MVLDPISITGLTIAVFDQLLRLSERTIQFVSDAKSFDETVWVLENKIRDEHSRSEQLKVLLFTPSPLYGHRALFEHFADDVQEQIKIFLVQALGKLQEAIELLGRKYSSRNSTSDGPPQSSNMLDRMRQSSRSPLLVVQWSFRDKKRTETILMEFTDLNRRIHENIKLFVLGSSLSVNHQQHLQHLESSPVSQRLGFSIDATLRLQSENSEQTYEEFELPANPWAQVLSQANPIKDHEQRYAIARDAGSASSVMILEYRHYEPVASDPSVNSSSCIDGRTRKLLNGLARLLQQPKERSFLIPRCKGWMYIQDREQIAFIYDIPAGCQASPVSLLDLLRDPKTKPSLNERLQVAFGLARCISQLQMVQWVHESFRSENVLFFPKASEPDQDTPGIEIDYKEPWVFGFEFSRPETFFSHGLTDVCLKRDVYRHPDRQGRPNVPFRKLHDIYALGVVLLEIGLWEPWNKLQKIETAYRQGACSLQALLIQHANRWLARRMGNKYRDIVVKCLSGHFANVEDTREELNLQQNFRAEVVDVLERSIASI